MKNQITWLLLGLAVLALGSAANAETPEQFDKRMAWWREARFGMFIHWGPVSLKGTEIGWSRDGMGTEVYDNLYKQFNPVKFNADEWVSIAKAAGMKYIVLTSKHHDGFCLWDTKYTDYNIMNSPLKRDVIKELSAACKKQGIVYGSYYSICDWRHPLYPIGNETKAKGKPHADMNKFNQFLKDQLAEQIKNYALGLVWFDGEWEAPWTHERAVDLNDFLRKLRPDIIINNRIDKGRPGMAGNTKAGFLGDYDPPEQEIGGFNMDRPWETCMTIGSQWAWKPNDGIKSLQQCLQTLILTAGGDGNLLFNVGPMPSGQIEPGQVARLKEMGAWLRKYGESVYGTRGGPWKPSKDIASTRKGNVAYLHILRLTGDSITLHNLTRKITGSSLLTGGKVEVKQTEQGVVITVPAGDRQAVDTLVKLELDGSAMDLAPVALNP
jgi:alpha-L-fucosidase